MKLKRQGQPIDQNLFERVGKEFDISRERVREYYISEVQGKSQNAMLEAILPPLRTRIGDHRGIAIASDADIDRTVEAIGAVLTVYAKVLAGGVEKCLVGRPVKPVLPKL